jgi:hypothetical protein
MGARTVALTGVTGQGLVGTDVPVVGETLSGVRATGSVGSVSAGARTVALTGVLARGAVGSLSVRYWSLIDDSENANWQNINNSQTAGWEIVETE